MRGRRFAVSTLLVFTLAVGVGAQTRGGITSITAEDLKQWLSFIASDQLQGRATYSEGLGVAANYIAEQLKDWGVKPGGDEGSYFQVVKVLGVRTASKASVTVNVNGQTRTFKDGEGITFPRNMGGKQTIDGDQIEFIGYGVQLPEAKVDDYEGITAKGKVIVYLGQGPSALPQNSFRILGARSRNALEKGAVAVIQPAGVFGSGRGGRGQQPAAQPPAGAGRGAAQPPAGGGRGAAQPDNGDFTTVQRYDRPLPPTVTAEDEFFEFLFSGSEVKYAEIKEKSGKREPLPRFRLNGVKVTFNVDADYTVVRTRLSRNVVGIVEGSDPKLKDTYILYGSHYDHTGYRETPPPATTNPGQNPGGCTGQVRPTPKPGDIVNNGADDDGSGTVAIMAVAKAFAQGPKPKRSIVFVWHTAEENGLLGSRYNADYPAVPVEKIVAVLNMDMVGRNRCDRESEANTVYLVGSDRISTELHNLSEDANTGTPKPLKLDYEFNDPADPESLYTRSDHYSYAVKGIPVIFYTTGLHRDYHYVTDEVDRIEFPKMARIAQLAYATGQRVANLDHAPVRDNKGPRAGKDKTGKLDAR